MKTMKFYAALSFVLIIALATSTSAANIGDLSRQPSPSMGIRYQVNINIANEQSLCNTYLIEIRDGRGQLVAPAQRYIPGVSRYSFAERGPNSGVRVATLKRAEYGNHFICDIELFTTPAVIFGNFLNGQTYRFDLFPSREPSKE